MKATLISGGSKCLVCHYKQLEYSTSLVKVRESTGNGNGIYYTEELQRHNTCFDNFLLLLAFEQ